MSLYKYLKTKGVTCQLKYFAKLSGVTTQTLRNYYKEDKTMLDGYIEQYLKGEK